MAKHPSMADVARAAGVSKNTVSLALRHDPQIPERTRVRVQEAARQLGYRYDPISAELMARMRRRSTGRQASLALVHAHPDPHAWKDHPTIPTYIEGCRRRAAERGYGLDLFWLHDAAVRGPTLQRIIESRGLRGVLVVGMMKTNRLPEHFAPLVKAFPCVVTGVRTHQPALSFACVDHYDLALRAFRRAVDLGYRRPALVIDETIDMLVDRRFSAGFIVGQQTLPRQRQLPPFYDVESARADLSIFAQWLDHHRPDMIFTLYHEVRGWLEELGRRVPEEIGLAQLERRPKHPDWAGMEQHNDLSGEAAVDMLIGMILRGESGPPLYPRASLMESRWVDGETLPARPSA
ncbi:MAG: LacI family DNA-binding transcriptional regulator [Verrucomicrobiota bacterium]